MEIKISTLDNNWKLFTLINDKGMEIQFLNYGGIITKILTPDKNKNIENIVLSYAEYKDYVSDPNYFGAIIGPVAGRIEGSNFSIAKENFNLEKNNGKNHLHSGSDAFHRVIWNTKIFETAGKVGVNLSYESKDGENGYPGKRLFFVTYTLSNDNQLIIDYQATTDKETPIALTNHTYFNLSGNTKNTIHNHYLTINSHNFLKLNEELIPTGEVTEVSNSSFNFIEGRKLNDGIMANSEQNKIVGNGYDHYFIFGKSKKENIVVKEETSGRVLKIETTQPGLVLYTGQNIVEGLRLESGTSKKYLGVCFETQSPPASLHHEGLPEVILKPNEVYKKQTIFEFEIEQ